MTRILVVGNFYPPHHHGGYELSCADVMERLAARGHEVTVLTSRYRRADVDEPVRGPVAVRRELDLYWDDHRLVSPPPLRRLRIERANQRRLRRAIAAADPEVVSVWNMGAMSLGLLSTLAERDIPLLYAVCNDWLAWGTAMDPWMRLFEHRPSVVARAVRLATRLPTRLPDLGVSGTFCFVSDWTRRSAESQSRWRFPDSTVVYSGIDTGDFPVGGEPVEDRPWGWRLLFVGRLDADKGVDTAVRALAHLPDDATLEVIGIGSAGERARVERAAETVRVGDRVRFDAVPREAMAGRYRAADAVLFPSRWEEPFGLVPLEAMACGTPVVATDAGGSGEFLADGVNCLVVPREAPDALASAVTRLAGDPDLRRRLAAGGRATAAGLTVDALADTFERWHLAVARRFADGRPPDRPPPGAAPAGTSKGALPQ